MNDTGKAKPALDFPGNAIEIASRKIAPATAAGTADRRGAVRDVMASVPVGRMLKPSGRGEVAPVYRRSPVLTDPVTRVPLEDVTVTTAVTVPVLPPASRRYRPTGMVERTVAEPPDGTVDAELPLPLKTPPPRL
jgi:hypothetical protein